MLLALGVVGSPFKKCVNPYRAFLCTPKYAYTYMCCVGQDAVNNTDNLLFQNIFKELNF